MAVCRWDGLAAAATPYGLTFGDATAVPAVPRAGRRFVVKVGVLGGDAAGEEVNAAIRSGALAAVGTIGGVDGAPLDLDLGYEADGRIHVGVTVPQTAAGKRLTIKLTNGPETHTGTKTVSFTVGPPRSP